MNDKDINQFNLEMRQQPWYQEWFAQRGLNPNRVKLSDSQREELTALIQQRSGFQMPKDMKIDPAGNLNEKGGWAGLPTGVKIAIIGGAAAATGGALGAFGGIGGTSAGSTAAGSTAAGSSAALPTLASSSLTSGMAGAAPSLAGLSTVGGTVGATTGAATGAGSVFGRIADAARNPQVIGAAGRMLAGAGQASADNRGAQTAAQFDHDRLALERDQMKLLAEKSARDAQSDAMNKAVWGNYVANYQPSVPDEVRPYAGTIRQPSEEERAAGRLLAQQAGELMQSGQYTNVNPSIMPYSEYPTRPGTFEQIANYASPALTFVGLYDELFGRK